MADTPKKNGRGGQVSPSKAPQYKMPPRRQLGLDAGKIVIADDFDAPMPDLEDLFYGPDSKGR